MKQTFKRCDLHVHSSSCESRSYSYEDFEQTLLDSELDVVAVTDHNSVDVELLNRLSEALSGKGKTLLAGVELNVKIDEETCERYNLVVSEDSDYFHGIAWCDLSDAPLLREAVFRLLDGIGISEQRRAGKTEKEISALSVGRAFFLNDVQRELGDIKHFFTFHESKGDNKRNLSGYLKNGQGGNDEFKHSLFYYNQRFAIEGGKKSKPISDFFEEDLNTMVCRFFCSDAKTLEKIGTAFTWIDFDGDIDSLNLAITDPQSRIVTSDESPVNPQSNLNAYLESVRFNLLNEEGVPTECEIRFAPSYNGIVGSRGSGKSMLAKILSGRASEGYERYVDSESVRFCVKGGQYSKNLPKCLYVKQGELGDVFDRADYRSVPFLEQRLKGMKEDARLASERHFATIDAQLDRQQEFITIFVDNYEGYLKRPDALHAEKPCGVSIKEAPSVHSDKEELNCLPGRIKSLAGQIELSKKAVSDLSIKESHPETLELIAMVNKRIEAAAEHLQFAYDNLDDIYRVVKLLKTEPFDTREHLVESFSNEIVETNRSKALGAHNYDRNISEASIFLDSLLDLRIELRRSDNAISDSVSSMFQPIAANTYQADEDEVSIGLTIAEHISYEEARRMQLKSGTNNATALIEFILQCSDLEKAKRELLNGTKYRNLKDPRSIIERFFSNIRNELSKNSEFDIDVSFNGVSMKVMSPGMQAQALLKLLLNDELPLDNYYYVVIDQPEDNLDTLTISDVLVSRLKRLKKELQVFVVSHSAPVVINGDARNVIMARNNGSSIAYSTGVINGPTAKEFISKVLDGGERFLKMRLYKYDFQMGDNDDNSE